MSQFQKTDLKALSGDFFTRLGKEWMLVSAGDAHSFNTMTASWGGIGVLWNKNVSFIFIRQSRHTMQFLDSNDYYSLSFFNGKMMKELTFCGKNSGRDVDKMKETGLIPVFDEKAPAFEQAELVLICKKLYKQPMDAGCFLDKELPDRFYADNDWHETFVGEIVDVLIRP